jgi:hypothetical protein
LQHQHVRIFNARYLLSQFQQLGPRLQNLLELDSLDRNSKKKHLSLCRLNAPSSLLGKAEESSSWKTHTRTVHLSRLSPSNIYIRSEGASPMKASQKALAVLEKMESPSVIASPQATVRLFCIDRWMSSSARDVVRAMPWSEIDL